MNTSVAKSLIDTIREEKKRRYERLSFADAELAYDQWLFTDEPFINEMCLMLLVAIRHQCERELVQLAARVVNQGAAMSFEEFKRNVRRLEKPHCWKEIIATLKLNDFLEWNTSMETLRLLVNCYKHSPSQQPNDELKKQLNLDAVNYLPLPESTCFREKLAVNLGLPQDADYCDIAEQLMNVTGQFLAKVKIKHRPLLSELKPSRPSMDPKDFAC